MQITLLNNSEGTLPLDHRALAYGDGLFETLLIHGSKPMYLELHLKRLFRGAQRLSLPWDAQQQAQLQSQTLALAAQTQAPHVMKWQLLRSAPGRGYSFDRSTQSVDLIIQLQPYAPPSWVRQGVHTRLAATPTSVNPVLAGLKHLNRLDSVLARAEYERSEVQEVIMADPAGRLIEGSMSNLLVRQGGEWYTPTLDNAGVDGVVRQQLIHLGHVTERSLTASDLPSAEGAAICGSLIGIVPILTFNQHNLAESAQVWSLKQELGFPW